MIVIGIGSRAQQGKSLFCSVIIERCSYVGVPCREYSISDAIIEQCVSEGLLAAGTARAQCDPNLLVRVGNEKRAGNENFWCDKIRALIERDRMENKIEVALIPNVRFPSEMALVKSLGGWTVRVVRLNANGTQFISPDRNPNDACECSLDLAVWDFEIINIAWRPFWLRRQANALFDYLREGGE